MIQLNKNCECKVKQANDEAFGDRFASHKETDPVYNGTIGKDNCIELRVLPPEGDKSAIEQHQREHKDRHDCFRTFYLQASSLKEAQEWAKAINHNIGLLSA